LKAISKREWITITIETKLGFRISLPFMTVRARANTQFLCPSAITRDLLRAKMLLILRSGISGLTTSKP
jgi:hypothetical protein